MQWTFLRCDLWLLWKLTLLVLTRLNHGAAKSVGAFKGWSGRGICILARFMELPCILYSCGLSCCIQIIVGPHPRLALKNPNIRLEWSINAKQGFIRISNSNRMLNWDTLIETQNAHLGPHIIVDQQEILVKTTSTYMSLELDLQIEIDTLTNLP